jgi:hypothetical protein
LIDKIVPEKQILIYRLFFKTNKKVLISLFNIRGREREGERIETFTSFNLAKSELLLQSEHITLKSILNTFRFEADIL